VGVDEAGEVRPVGGHGRGADLVAGPFEVVGDGGHRLAVGRDPPAGGLHAGEHGVHRGGIGATFDDLAAQRRDALVDRGEIRRLVAALELQVGPTVGRVVGGGRCGRRRI